MDSARNRGWGHVVTKDCPEALAKAIVDVVKNSEMAKKVVRGALDEAQSRLAVHHAKRLHQFLQVNHQELSSQSEISPNAIEYPNLA